VNRSHVIRLHTTPKHETYFRKACGAARHANNWALARWKEAHTEGKRIKMNDLRVQCNETKGKQIPCVYETTRCSPELAFADLGEAFANYWYMQEEGTQPKLKHLRKDGKKVGFPHFKSKKHDRLSFHLTIDKFSVDGYILRVPKLGDVKITEESRFAGKIRSATIFYRAGWWFISVEGSQNWWKYTKKLAKAHYRLACQRQRTLHKMTTQLAHTSALIGLEDLNTKAVLAGHHVAQAVSDASFLQVKRQLLYKAEQYGCSVQLVDRWFPSSKTCHVCGWVKQDLILADRVWMCEQCGNMHGCEMNAAVTVEKEALRLATDDPGVTSSERKFAWREREALTLAKAKRASRRSRYDRVVTRFTTF
jgi:putative transposase